MTDPVPSSLLRQEGPQQERVICECGTTMVCPDLGCDRHKVRAALSTLRTDLSTDLLARLRDYHDQVLKGFRHISRVEEADLIQAAIDGLWQPTWMPIETAAKESKMVYVAARATRDEPLTAMFAYWNQEHAWWYRLYAHEPTRIYPTHWMPLPPAPKE